AGDLCGPPHVAAPRPHPWPTRRRAARVNQRGDTMFFPIFSIIIGAGFGVLVLLGFMLGWYVDTHYLAYSAIIDWEWAGNPFQKAAALIDLAAWGIAG